MQRIGFLSSVLAIAMLLVFSGLAAAQGDSVPPSDNGQDAANGGAQPNAAPDCDQNALLDALSSADLASNGAQDNSKLLSQFVGCGGTIAQLPQQAFNTLLMQGTIELDIVGSGGVACPRGDKSHCSPVAGF